jgi:hypothetical protein
MMPSIRRKLDALAERHQEVALLLAQPGVSDDNARFRELSREYAQLEPLTSLLARYDAAGRSLDAARALLDDADMRDLAESEIADLQAQRERLDAELSVLLLPKDARARCHCSRRACSTSSGPSRPPRRPSRAACRSARAIAASASARITFHKVASPTTAST